MRRWLVTGGTGFIGGRFVAQLARGGDEIFPLSRGGRGGTIRADVFDAQQMSDLIAQIKPTHLALLAWTTQHGTFWEDPANETWCAANAAIAETFLAAGGKRILGVGSCAEYSWDGRLLTEDQSPILPRTRYGTAKAELWTGIERACERYSASGVWARVFFVYGVGEHPDKLVSSLVRSAIRGDAVAVRDPDRRLDLIHVDDVARGLAALAQSGATGACNVATGTGTTVREVAGLAGATLAPADTVSVREREPDVVGETARLSKLGWSAEVALRDGVAQLRHALLAGEA
jgi:nucleoside-diphosphate-sugar epimerase